MRKQSKELEDTALWQVYQKRMHLNNERTAWVKKVYQTAANYLKDVRQVFKNYTLHDETHILNVLDAMGGLLGDCIENLTDGEVELLILAASLHDIGMVYTKEEINFCFEDETACKAFLRDNRPELLGCASKDWPQDIQQWYLRTLHPFRISEKLQNTEWQKLFGNHPIEMVSKRCVLAVCQAHGEEADELLANPNLKFQAASDVDPLFCALLLRLADLLDFDETRAPMVLYSYAADYEKSQIEWDKHQASAGFRYPDTPSVKELPYKARCKNPVIEHSVRRFLDWVDDELDNCTRLQRYCNAVWQKEFSFPKAVLRSEIESDGYMSGDFCLTMDKDQILKLLIGENLYDNRDVFVRELLQNAVDATLLRDEMDESFVLDEARIDIWEWSDSEGNFWFRIDDQGVGMTLGMLQRYFLKVGNSYYTSQELKRDLLDHGKKEDFHGISRFGIGFLSCFLCGDYAEVSTLYFDPQKNFHEETYQRNLQTVHYGLRLQMTGWSGYYTIKSQAENHLIETTLPVPNFCDFEKQIGAERFGYRLKAGTSIAIRLAPGKLGALNLKESVKKYLCGAKIEVRYNGKRIGRTYGEAMKTIHEMEGERVYEFDLEMKKKFDECFPAIHGNYPKLVQTVIPLDTEENQILSGVSGVIVKHDICFEQKPQWTGKGQNYVITSKINFSKENSRVVFKSENVNLPYVWIDNGEESMFWTTPWKRLMENYESDKIENLSKKLNTFDSCPQTVDQLGDVWIPFLNDLDLPVVWATYINSFHEKILEFDIERYGCLNLRSVFQNNQIMDTLYVYQGILADWKTDDFFPIDEDIAVFLLEREWKPKVEISRSRIVGLPLELLMAIYAILNKYDLLDSNQGEYIYKLIKWETVTLAEWRKVRYSSVGQWIEENQNKNIEEVIQEFQKQCVYDSKLFESDSNPKFIMNKYIIAYLQDEYSMTISYEEGQIVRFYDKMKSDCENVYDIFPSLMFCKAASEQSRIYICHAENCCRRGITADHPFIAWLLENAIQLRQHFQRQFQQLIECLCIKDAKDIIEIYDVIREQIYSLSNRYGLNVKSLPQLTLNDFWTD